MYDYNLAVQYYNDKLFGVSHEIKLGVEYEKRRVTTVSTYPGNVFEQKNLNWADIDPLGTGNPVQTPGMTYWNLYSNYNIDYGVKALTGFVQDTITTGRFNIMLGLRYDHQQPSINASIADTVNNNPVWTTYFDPGVKSAIQAFMPGVATPYIQPNYHWDVFSPRLGITYDLFGTGKTILKLSGSMYGDFMGSGSASYLFAPYGVFSGWTEWYWLDGYNGNAVDNKMQAGEMFAAAPGTYAPVPMFNSAGTAISDAYTALLGYWYGGFTPGSSTPGASRYTVDPNATSSRTWELLATIDHELLPDFSVGLSGTYRKYNHFSWNPMYYTNGEYGDYTIDGASEILDYHMYEVAGQLPTSGAPFDLGQAAGKNFYLLSSGFGYSPYNLHTLNTNYETYWGIDLVWNKRLSNKWMLDGSLSYMDQKYHYGNGYQNPTNLWAINDQIYAPSLGGASGKIGQYIFSHWMMKLEGLYQLPYDFNVSFTCNARAGHLIPQYVNIVDRPWQSTVNAYSYSVSTYLATFGKAKLPTFFQLNFRLEKMIKIADAGRIYLMADVFNLLNSHTINRRYDMNEGSYYLNNNGTTSYSAYANDYRINEILNPRIMRLGVRFQF